MQTPAMAMTSSTRGVGPETSAAEKLQRRRRRQCSILSLPAKRTDYSLEHNTEPFGPGVANGEIAPGTVVRHDVTWELRSPEMAVSLQPKRLVDAEFEHVDDATCNSGTKLKPSERIQSLMARFDEDIKARVESNVKQRRRHQKQAASFSEPRLVQRPREWDLGPTQPTEQAQRRSTTEQNWAPSASEVIVIKYEVPIDDIGLAVTGDSPVELENGFEQERGSNTETPVEGDASAEFGPPTDISYAERKVIPEHAITAHVVKPGKARVVKVTPRAASVHDAAYRYGAFQDSLMGQRNQLGSTRRPNHTRISPERTTRQNHRRTFSKPDLNKREKRMARSLQPEDFVPRTDPREGWPKDARRHNSPPESPILRPIPPHTLLVGGEDDNRSMISINGAEDNEVRALPTAPLFNMPNSPFLYHVDQDDECPSLIADDGQDRRPEETRHGSSEQDPSPSSWEFHPGSYTVGSGEEKGLTPQIKRSASTATGMGITRRPTISRHPALATRRGKPLPLNLEIKGDEFVATAENPYQAGSWAECETNWI